MTLSNLPQRNRTAFKPLLLLSCAALLSACMEKPKPLPPQDAPFITAFSTTVPQVLRYSSKTAPSLEVSITARTPGYIEEILFSDGQDVAKDQPLYTIEFTTNQAEADQARANVTVSRANLKQAQHDYARAQRLIKSQSISQEDFENYRLAMEQSEGALQQSEAKLVEARKNLSYTHIGAPFAGRISRTLYYTGDLVGVNGQTVLTSLLQLDPIYTYFNIPSTQLQRVLSARGDKPSLPVVFTLSGDTPMRVKGSLDFIDNQVSSTSGTIEARATLPNAKKQLYPGQFGTIEVQVGQQNNALLVPQAVVKQDLQGSYLFTVDDQNKLQRKDIELGDHYQGWVVVKKGLTTSDRVISGHLMLMRAGLEVAPREDSNFPPPTIIVQSPDEPASPTPPATDSATSTTPAADNG